MLKRKRNFGTRNEKMSVRKGKNMKQKDHSKNGIVKKFPKKISEEISSDSDVDDSRTKRQEEPDTSDEEITEQEKRLKLAKKYLSVLEKEENDKAECEETVNDEISKRLKQDVLEQAGQLQRKVADRYEGIVEVKIIRGHKLPVTCVTVSQNEKFMYSGSKDCSLIKWSLETGHKLTTIHGGRKGEESRHVGHTAHILCLALTNDDKFLVSGDSNKVIHVWMPETMAHLHTFPGHRGAVTGLAFRKGTHQLFSVSTDRSVKIWNVDEMAYVETLFGHQDSITSVDSLTRDRAVTSGGRDSTVRLWKVPEESQLIFQSRSESIDFVRLINEKHFVSIADDGSIALWGLMKKKPLAVVPNAHGEGYWLSAVATLANTDLVATGSHSGEIKLWKCGDDFKSLSFLFNIEAKGFVNALEFTKSGSRLIAAIGREHRFGRWFCNKEAKNCILVATLDVENL